MYQCVRLLLLSWLALAKTGHVRSESPAANSEPPQPASVRFCLPHANSVNTVTFSPDGKTLATGTSDGTIWLWKTATGKSIRKIEGHRDEVGVVVFSPDGTMMASASHDCSVRVWELSAFRELHRFNHRVVSLSFSPDGSHLASGSGPLDGIVRLWQLPSGREISSWAADISSELAFCPDGKTLITGGTTKPFGGRGLARLWRLPTGQEICQFRGHEWPIFAVAISPDGKIMASGSGGHDIRLWEIATGKEISKVEVRDLVCKLAFSPDGRTLASSHGGGPIRLWAFATGEHWELKGHDSTVWSVAFSPDGQSLASASLDKTARLWDIAGSKITDRQRNRNPSSEDLQTLWRELGGDDAAKAQRAVWQLIAAPEQSVRFLQARLRPVPSSVTPEQIGRLIADLDSARFLVREKATAELEKLGDLAQVPLQEALKGIPALEVRSRIERLLGKPERWSSDRLQVLRAIQALEQIGNEESRSLLTKLATATAQDRLTQEAKATLERLAKRPGNRR